MRAALARMTSAYQARFPFLVDWTNEHGKTPLHLAAIAGNDMVVDVSYTLEVLVQCLVPTCFGKIGPSDLGSSSNKTSAPSFIGTMRC